MNNNFHCFFPCNPAPSFTGGEWGAWSDYNSCSETCGEGVKTRTRTCPTGRFCSGDATETATCTEAECPGTSTLYNYLWKNIEIL